MVLLFVHKPLLIKTPKTKQDSGWTRMSSPAVWRLLRTSVSWKLCYQHCSVIKATKERSEFTFLTFFSSFCKMRVSNPICPSDSPPSKRKELRLARCVEGETIMPMVGGGPLTYSSRIGKITSFAYVLFLLKLKKRLDYTGNFTKFSNRRNVLFSLILGFS